MPDFIFLFLYLLYIYYLVLSARTIMCYILILDGGNLSNHNIHPQLKIYTLIVKYTATWKIYYLKLVISNVQSNKSKVTKEFKA